MAKGDTKTNQYLDIAANGTRADVQHGCCETRTQSLIMDVADRIITEEETRAREDQILQNEIDEIKNNPDVADIVPTYAALQDYDTSKLTDKDIIRVLADETHGGASTYYRWSTSSETFTYVGETGDYYTKSQVNDLLDDKQDLLTAGDGITIEEESGALVISSTGGGGGTSNFNQLTNRPSYNGVTMTGSTNIPEVKTYSAGTGLSLTGTAFSIDNTVALKTDIPTVNDATLTITQNGVSKGTFTANDADNTTIELTDNDTTYSAGTNVQISAQNVISATDTTYSAGTGLDLTDTTFSADTTVLATKTDLEGKQDELTAGDNVTIEDESGALVISATDTTYSDFTGTDGTAAGTAGLVPAPAITDAGKFLSASGLWEEVAGGSGITELTTADYNYPATNPDSIALWTLGPGIYQLTENLSVRYNTTDSVDNLVQNDSFLILGTNSRVVIIRQIGSKGVPSFWVSNPGSGYKVTGETDLGGGSITPVQTTGTSTTDVMSQNAVTSMVFADPATQYKIKIGAGTSSHEGANGIEIGYYASANGLYSVAMGFEGSANGPNALGIGGRANAYGGSSTAVGYGALGYGSSSTALGATAIVNLGINGGSAIGFGATSNHNGSVALGALSTTTGVGQVNIGTSATGYGYNSSNYRLLTGLYDPQSAHDAATKGYVDPTTDSSAPTTATVGRLGQIFIDTTNADAYMCVAVDSVTPTYSWKKINA